MNRSVSVENFWRDFCAEYPDVEPLENYQVWYFGSGSADAAELCKLVLEGKKTATASLPLEFEAKPEDAPIVNGYSVVTDYEGVPQCVVRTTEIRLLSFNEVDAQFAFDEGEGDQSLDYWRGVHWEYFSRRCAELNQVPSLAMTVYCERFQLLYRKPQPA